MNITLKRTDEQVELVKAMASKNRGVAYEAQMALADFIGPVLCEVINQAPTSSVTYLHPFPSTRLTAQAFHLICTTTSRLRIT